MKPRPGKKNSAPLDRRIGIIRNSGWIVNDKLLGWWIDELQHWQRDDVYASMKIRRRGKHFVFVMPSQPVT